MDIYGLKSAVCLVAWSETLREGTWEQSLLHPLMSGRLVSHHCIGFPLRCHQRSLRRSTFLPIQNTLAPCKSWSIGFHWVESHLCHLPDEASPTVDWLAALCPKERATKAQISSNCFLALDLFWSFDVLHMFSFVHVYDNTMYYNVIYVYICVYLFICIYIYKLDTHTHFWQSVYFFLCLVFLIQVLS